jgi:hypothetical protein
VGERNFGARWWRESLGIARWASRPALGTMSLFGALSLGGAGCAIPLEQTQLEETQLVNARDDVDVNVDALQLQRDEGWDVGQTGAALAFPDSTVLDAAGTQRWRDAMSNLAGAMMPSSAALRPFYVPTLFQSLIGPAGQRLRAVMRPIHTSEMEEDFARGIALRAQFGGANWPKDTALVVDAPGPRAVAVAAALADHFALVFTFANWPHPLGVVPAHQTIAASLYYLPMFAAAEAVRPADAPPLFVLDANRLAPYGDADQQFDNRYFVKLPTAEQLAALGVKHVLYVGTGAQELDDLNHALVALCQKGVDVKMVALGDFVRAGDEPAMALNDDVDNEDDDAPVEAVDPAWTWAFGWARPAYLWPHYWYRGCWWNGGLFWGDYGWYPTRPAGFGGPVGNWRGRGPVVVRAPSAHRVPLAALHAGWAPAARATMFTPAFGTPRSGATFGQVAVLAARSDGHIVGMRAGSTAFNGGARVNGAGFRSAGNTTFHSSVFHSGSYAARSGSVGRAGASSVGGG